MSLIQNKSGTGQQVTTVSSPQGKGLPQGATIVKLMSANSGVGGQKTIVITKPGMNAGNLTTVGGQRLIMVTSGTTLRTVQQGGITTMAPSGAGNQMKMIMLQRPNQSSITTTGNVVTTTNAKPMMVSSPGTLKTTDGMVTTQVG
jgi:sugar lactone lactonase YvrE